MGESSTCLMRSFSQPSPTAQDPQEGDPLRHALTASISFGRFMSESLAWEKWSSFTQNRHLEEIEKYSKPGSVAEKKAYFEAHYKRKAAQKVAASLEQQNAAVDDIPSSSLTTDNNSPIEMAQGQEGLHVAIEDGLVEKDPTSDLNLSVDECGQSPLEGYKIESDRIEGMEQGKQPTFVDNLPESSILPEYDHSPLKGCRIESDQIEGTEQGIEQPTSVENQVESSILPEYGQSPLLECRIEDEQNYVTQQEIGHPSFVQKEVELSTLLEDAQYVIDQQDVKAPAQETAAMEVSASSDKKKLASSSGKSSGPKQESRLRPPLKPTIPVQPRNGDQATSYSKRTGRESVEKKRSTPKSIHMSINFGSLVGNTNKSSSPELQKINSRLVRNLCRTTRESTKQQTPTMASTHGVSKHLAVTPEPAIRRTKKVLNHPIPKSRTGDRKSESLYMRSSISSTTRRTNAQCLIESASFNLRTEERATIRQEKLQQKLSKEAAEKELLRARLKGSIRKDAKDVRQSITSQGKANSSFHPGMKPLHVQMEKTTRTQPCSPGVQRKQKYEVLPNNTRPTWRHSVKADNFKDPLGKNHRTTNYPAKSFLQINSTDENSSPNIQV